VTEKVRCVQGDLRLINDMTAWFCLCLYFTKRLWTVTEVIVPVSKAEAADGPISHPKRTHYGLEYLCGRLVKWKLGQSHPHI